MIAKRIFLAAWMAAIAAALHGAVVEVTDVQVKTGYPWGRKAEIEFTLGGDHPGAEYKVWTYCYDEVGNKALPTTRLQYNGEGEVRREFFLRAGRHRLVWDAQGDVPNGNWGNLSINVDAELNSEEKNAYAAKYLVIDLSAGPDATSYPFEGLNDVPAGGWTDEYKTTKLVMRKCPKGRDPTDASAYEITSEFYAGVFEVTQKQWELVMGTRPSGFDGADTKPVEKVSWEDIRGANAGSAWPANAEVDADSFMGRLRAKTGFLTLDLPTKSMGEYACRAGTKTIYYTGDSESDLSRAAWYRSADSGNGIVSMGGPGISDGTHPVGLKEPNGWDLYDTLGNVAEWCLDWFPPMNSGYQWDGKRSDGTEERGVPHI